MEKNLDGLQEQRDREPRTLARVGGTGQSGAGGVAVHSHVLLGLPRSQSYLYFSPSPWHLAAIMGEQIAASSPSLGSRHSWGPPHLPHQHRTQLGVPRAMLPKTKRGWEPKRAQTPEIDTLTPLPTVTPQREATSTNTLPVCRD